MLEFAEDMVIDIPMIYTYLAELISPMIQDGSLPISFLKPAFTPLISSNKAGVLVAKVLHEASERLVSMKVLVAALFRALFNNFLGALYRLKEKMIHFKQVFE